MKKLIIYLGAILVLLACRSAQRSNINQKPKPKLVNENAGQTTLVGGVIFQDSDFLSPVLEKAQLERKPVFLEFHAKWCAPCKLMEEDVFTQKSVFSYLNTNFLNFRADFDSENGKRLAGLYEVEGLPTIIFLDPKGIVLARQIGAAQFSDLKRMGDSALAKMK